jgi:hypothetical protein
MTASPRKPMSFNVPPPVSVSPPAPPPAKSAEPALVADKGGEPVGDSADRQQVGARVPKSVYRQLKAKAALSGVTVQTLVEQAIVEFLARAWTPL